MPPPPPRGPDDFYSPVSEQPPFLFSSGKYFARERIPSGLSLIQMMLRQGRRRLLRAAATIGRPTLQQPTRHITRNSTNGNARRWGQQHQQHHQGHGGGGGWNQSGTASFLRRWGSSPMPPILPHCCGYVYFTQEVLLVCWYMTASIPEAHQRLVHMLRCRACPVSCRLLSFVHT